MPALVTILTQQDLGITERRLLSYAVIALAVHIPLLLLTVHNDRRTAYMISQGQMTDAWRVVLSHINNIIYPFLIGSLLAAWAFIVIILLLRIWI